MADKQLCPRQCTTITSAAWLVSNVAMIRRVIGKQWHSYVGRPTGRASHIYKTRLS